jgi:hypothetical protein
MGPTLGAEVSTLCEVPNSVSEQSIRPEEEEEETEEEIRNPVEKKRLKQDQVKVDYQELSIATDGSEGQFLSHPTTVDAAVTGGVHYGEAVSTTLVTGVRDDDPSISALPGTKGRSICPTLEAEVGTTCEEQTSFQDAACEVDIPVEEGEENQGGRAKDMDERRAEELEMDASGATEFVSNFTIQQDVPYSGGAILREGHIVCSWSKTSYSR